MKHKIIEYMRAGEEVIDDFFKSKPVQAILEFLITGILIIIAIPCVFLMFLSLPVFFIAGWFKLRKEVRKNE